jgi:hypothetical protein
MAAVDWKTLLYLKPADFHFPDRLQSSVVVALDRFIGQIGSRPVILSDYRPDDYHPAGQHGQGLAIDTTWPGHEPLDIWSKAVSCRLFSGLGIYVNEVGAVSFHFDNRLDRLVNDPALWGAVITHPLDRYSGQHLQLNEYTTADVIVDIIKKKGVVLITFLIGFLLLYYLTKRR